MSDDSGGPTRAHTSDRRNGSTLFHELHVVDVEDVPEVDFPGAVELWRVKQTTVPDDPIQASAEEVRYFVSNMPASFLTPMQKFELVRLHWGIENGFNWTVDVALGENDVRPCQASRDSIEVVTWLRVLADNLLAVWRAGSPKKDRRPLPWSHVMEQLRDAFLVAAPGASRHVCLTARQLTTRFSLHLQPVTCSRDRHGHRLSRPDEHLRCSGCSSCAW